MAMAASAGRAIMRRHPICDLHRRLGDLSPRLRSIACARPRRLTAVDHDIGMCTATLLPDPLAPTADRGPGGARGDCRRRLHARLDLGRPPRPRRRPARLRGGTSGARRPRTAGEHDRGIDVVGHRATRRSGARATTSCSRRQPPLAPRTCWPPASTPPPIDLDVATAGPRRACVSVAGRSGVTVCLEFLPWIGRARPGHGVAPGRVGRWRSGTGRHVPLAAPAGRSRSRRCLDAVDRIGAVQVCDALATPAGDTMTEAMTARLLPGDGVVDIGQPCVSPSRTDVVVTAEIFNTPTLDRGSKGADDSARPVDACQSDARLMNADPHPRVRVRHVAARRGALADPRAIGARRRPGRPRWPARLCSTPARDIPRRCSRDDAAGLITGRVFAMRQEAIAEALGCARRGRSRRRGPLPPGRRRDHRRSIGPGRTSSATGSALVPIPSGDWLRRG